MLDPLDRVVTESLRGEADRGDSEPDRSGLRVVGVTLRTSRGDSGSCREFPELRTVSTMISSSSGDETDSVSL